MSKKSRKQARKRAATISAVSAAATQVKPVAETVAVPSSAGRVYTSEFNPDYSQTIKDLKRIGILAGTFFAILVVLSFFLH